MKTTVLITALFLSFSAHVFAQALPMIPVPTVRYPTKGSEAQWHSYNCAIDSTFRSMAGVNVDWCDSSRDLLRSKSDTAKACDYQIYKITEGAHFLYNSYCQSQRGDTTYLYGYEARYTPAVVDQIREFAAEYKIAATEWNRLYAEYAESERPAQPQFVPSDMQQPPSDTMFMQGTLK